MTFYLYLLDISTIKIASLNCRGLRDQKKRKDVFKFLREKQSPIYCLQDTHLIEADNKIIHSQWGLDHILTPGRSDARGVLNLFNKNFEYTIGRIKRDDLGNILVSEIKISNEISITLANLYGPNKDSPEFYEKLHDIIGEFDNQFIIICGDWNLVQDFRKDTYNYVTQNNQRSLAVIEKIKNDYNLIDPWRTYNPESVGYTWQRSNPIKQARLDYFLISQELLSLIKNVKILPGYRTDHSYIELELKINNFEKGKGFWHFNNSLLRDPEYVRKIKDCILQNKEEYVPLPILKSQIPNISNESLPFVIEDALFLEVLLMNIRGITISYSSWKKKEQNETKSLLEIEIKNLQKQFDFGHDQQINDRLNDLKTELENIRKHELNGLILRAGARWIEDGEKPTNYFCNLEKSNFVNKTVSKLISQDGNEIIDQKQILTEIKNFYENLYKSREKSLEDANLNEIFEDQEIPILSDEDRNRIDQDITKAEILEVLKKSKNNKSPGIDGFSTEVFKFFWTDLGDFIFRSFKNSFTRGELSQSQKLGIISILPMGNKPREFLKNWRPISLLNVTYKILSGVIANRFKSVLGKVIHENQKGYIAGRYIGENTRLLYDIVHNCNKSDIPGIILMVDFEKAFDSVSWKFIRNVLKFYNFGENIIRWIDIFFNDFKLCVIQNRIYSEFFNIGRGCRQGDPVSSYIFLFCVEIMGAMLRKNKDIKGINIMNKEYKLLQYADDTAILLDGSEKSLKNTLSLIEQFSKFSGLKPNFQKTSCIRIGSLRNSTSENNFCTEYELTWTQEPFSFLGIIFSVDLANIIELNFDGKLAEIRRLIMNWNRRLLSTAGKITVVKSILMPKLTHLFISLPNPPQTMIKDFEKLFFRFIWNGENDRIARKNLAQDYSNGGMRMICVNSFIKSLKVTWMRRIMMSDEKISWYKLLIDTLPFNFESHQSFGSYFYKNLAEKITNPFWQDLFFVILRTSKHY